MSGSDPRPTARLTVRAPDPYTEVFVIDDAFRRRATGVGHVEADLPPGIYKVKYKGGGGIREEFVRLAEGDERTVAGSALRFASAAPIADTRTSHEYHLYPAQEESLAPPLEHGGNAGLFVFARWLAPDRDAMPDTDPGEGIVLCDANGEPLLPLDREGVGNPADGWSSVTLEAPPGPYLLRIDRDGRATERTLFLHDDWQLQLFIGRDPPGSDGRHGRVRTTAFMAPAHAGFDHARPDGRRTELARAALEDNRWVVSTSELNEMLYAKWQNPILGILGALVYTRRPEPKLELLNKVVDNLAGLVGPDHPDVAALAWWLALQDPDRPPHTHPVAVPPMTRAAWDLLVEATPAFPEAVPPGSLAEAVSDHIRTGDAWLAWDAAPATPAGTPATAPFEESWSKLAEAGLVGIAGVGAVSLPVASVVTGLAAAFLGVAARASRETEGATPEWTRRRAAMELGVPPSTVDRVAQEAVEGLDPKG